MATRILNTKMFGADWVNNYSHPFNPPRTSLQRCGLNATGLCDALATGGTKVFNYGNADAWDTDIEQKFDPPTNFSGLSTLASGQDDQYAEKVDLFFFSGHGVQSALLFGVPDRDNGEARFNEMQLGQGGKLKWFIADACKVLEELGAKTRWKGIFKGLRYLLGFDGDCRDLDNRGLRFALHLRGVATVQAQQGGAGAAVVQGETIWRAWELACIETEGSSNLNCACLRAGGDNSIVHQDRWTDDTVEVDNSADFTYWKNAYTSAS